MGKRIHFSQQTEIRSMQRRILEQADTVIAQISTLFSDGALPALVSLKFEKTVDDTVFGEHLNFVEYLNQTFTYLVCLYAAHSIMNDWPDKGVIVNFGTQAGYDVATVDGVVICECFAATTAKSNDKLQKDVARVYGDAQAKERFVFFYDHSVSDDADFIRRIRGKYPGVSIQNIPMSALTEPFA